MKLRLRKTVVGLMFFVYVVILEQQNESSLIWYYSQACEGFQVLFSLDVMSVGGGWGGGEKGGNGGAWKGVLTY